MVKKPHLQAFIYFLLKVYFIKKIFENRPMKLRWGIYVFAVGQSWILLVTSLLV